MFFGTQKCQHLLGSEGYIVFYYHLQNHGDVMDFRACVSHFVTIMNFYWEKACC